MSKKAMILNAAFTAAALFAAAVVFTIWSEKREAKKINASVAAVPTTEG